MIVKAYVPSNNRKGEEAFKGVMTRKIGIVEGKEAIVVNDEQIILHKSIESLRTIWETGLETNIKLSAFNFIAYLLESCLKFFLVQPTFKSVALLSRFLSLDNKHRLYFKHESRMQSSSTYLNTLFLQ